MAGLAHFWRKNGIAYAFILPAFAFLVVFMLYPMVDGLVLSFYRWKGITARQFIGFSNFTYIVRDPKFLTALINTVFFTVVTTVAKITLGFLLAAALHGDIIGSKFFRSVFYLNVILPMTAVGVLWGVILNPNTGPIQALLGPLGGSMPSMLGSPTRVMWTLCMVDIWKHVGFPMIFFLAAMEGIPPELYEAAELDGASGVQRIWHITLPLVKSVLLVITMLQTIFSFKVFDIVFTMTKGGPANASQVLTTYLYQEGFWFQRFGSASAAGLVLLAICMVFSYFYVRQGRIGQTDFEY
jgi:ABC-type sugar transport system permease subunit